jgi:hypothetical protein
MSGLPQDFLLSRLTLLVSCQSPEVYYARPDEYEVFIRSSVDEAIAAKLAKYCFD